MVLRIKPDACIQRDRESIQCTQNAIEDEGMLDENKLKLYDLILLDLQMPEYVDGLKMLSLLKRSGPDIPIVMLTASDASRPVREAFSTGASGYFLKRRGRSHPSLTRFDELVDIILSLRTYHGRHGKLRKLYRTISELTATAKSLGSSANCLSVMSPQCVLIAGVFMVVRSFIRS